MSHFNDLSIRLNEMGYPAKLPGTYCQTCGGEEALLDVTVSMMRVHCNDPECEGFHGSRWVPSPHVSGYAKSA
jgi:hypothetical protein